MSARNTIKSGKKIPANKSFRSSRGIWIAGAALVVIALLGVIFFQQNLPAASGEFPREISVGEAYQRYEAGVFVLDVRQPEEWIDYHIPGTTLIPLGDLEGRMDELPRDQEIVVVCRSGNRSGVGRDALIKAGFTDVTSMAGGLVQWRAAGYPTVSGE